jgi:hypothetical protein
VQFAKFQAAQAQLAEVQNHPPFCFGAEIATGCSNPDLANVIIPDPGFGNADEPTNPECFVQLNNARVTPCTFGSTDSAAPRIALVGDSHAYQYLPAFIRLADKNGWALTTYFKGACPWTTAAVGGADPGFIASCTEYREHLATDLTNAKFDVIVTAAFNGTEYLGDNSTAAVASGFAQAWSTQNGGARVIAVADNPDFTDDPNKCLRSKPAAECARPRPDVLLAEDPLMLAAAQLNLSSVDLRGTFCSTTTCLPVISGADVFRDQDHLTATFANTMGFAFQRAVLLALK